LEKFHIEAELVLSSTIERLELGLKHVGFEKKKDGYFTGSNIAENLKVLRFETDVNDTDIRLSSIARRVRWKNLMAQYLGKIDLRLAKQFEADHFDSFVGKESPGSRTLCGHFELDPATGLQQGHRLAVVRWQHGKRALLHTEALMNGPGRIGE